MQRIRPTPSTNEPAPARPAVRLVSIANTPGRRPTARPARSRDRQADRADRADPTPSGPELSPTNYLDGIAPIPDRLADLFASADDCPPICAERVALAEAIDAAAERVREARSQLEQSQAIRGRRPLRGGTDA